MLKKLIFAFGLLLFLFLCLYILLVFKIIPVKRTSRVYQETLNKNSLLYDDYHKQEVNIDNIKTSSLKINVVELDRYMTTAGLVSMRLFENYIYAKTLLLPAYYYDPMKNDLIVVLRTDNCNDLVGSKWLIINGWNNSFERWDGEPKVFNNTWGYDNVTFKLNKINNNDSIEIDNNGISYTIPVSGLYIEERIINEYIGRENSYWVLRNFGQSRVYCDKDL